MMLKMISDAVRTGVKCAPQRSLLRALGQFFAFMSLNSKPPLG